MASLASFVTGEACFYEYLEAFIKLEEWDAASVWNWS
jgi:hypothetical protein